MAGIFSRCGSIVQQGCRGVGWLLRSLTGLSWQAPAWLQWSGRAVGRVAGHARARPVRSAIIALLLGLMAAAAWWAWDDYRRQPTPRTVSASLAAPAVTAYRTDDVVVRPLVLRFGESVAPLAHIGKPVTAGVRMTPALAGEWRWDTGRSLVFRPAQDWPIGQRLDIRLDRRALLAEGVLLETERFETATPAFSGSVVQRTLYQDPVHPDRKHLQVHLRFSHPVDAASLASRARVVLGAGLDYLEGGQSLAPAIHVDEDKVNVYVRSAPLAVPLEPSSARLEINRGVAPAAGGAAIDEPWLAEVTVPGRYQLAFSGVKVQFAENAQGEPEPVLLFASSHALRDAAIQDKAAAWLLPERDEAWHARDVDEATLARSEPVALTHVPSIEPLNRQHAYQLAAPPGRFLYVRVEAGVEAVGGYLARQPTSALIKMPAYPTLMRFLSDGALLSLKGEQRLGLMARGVEGVQIEVSRLLSEQLHHLVDQHTGTLVRPRLAERYVDRLVERETQEIRFPGADPTRTYYDAVDLGRYLRHDGGRKGIFVVRMSDIGRDTQQTFVRGASVGDTRLVLVTDLGIIAKRQADGAYQVFVQSISRGEPVTAARVTMVGRNGLPVAEAQTDAQGRAQFADVSELRREKSPLMVVVSQGDDLSFLPLSRQDQRLDFSRFDVGGQQGGADAARLEAYLFTDRGLYRPGETVNLGMIVKRSDWQPGIQGLPVELVVTDPRGAVVQRTPFALGEAGFESRTFSSAEQAPAGRYDASLVLIGRQQRVVLGRTFFSVRAFEPDRMKVQLSLSEQPLAGWLRPEQVRALVDAQHLFGAPAADRRVLSELSLEPAHVSFRAYPGYRFSLSDRLTQASHEELAETRTDAEGRAVVALGLERFSAGAYQLRLSSRVLEAGSGRGVAAEQTALVVARPWLVGVRSEDSLDFIPAQAARMVHWQAIDAGAQPVAVQGLRTRLVEHRYVSVLVEQRDGTYRYESRLKDVEHEVQALSLPVEGAEQALPTSAPGAYSLVLEDARGERLNAVRFDVAGQGNVARSLERHAELQLTLDKRSYAPGEDISLSIRAPYTGAGLITIERDQVYTHKWFRTEGNSSVQTITLPPGIEGNAYVNVQFVRDPGSDAVYMSPLSYAVASFSIDLDARRLPVALDAPPVVLPGEPLALTLDSPRATRAIVYVVDEGILQVARYDTPDPLSFFFRKRALEVDTRQILNLILPDFSLLMQASAPGGDAEAERASHLNPFKRKRQPPVAWWSGVIDLPAGRSTVTYPVPEGFNGRLRAMVVAVDDVGIGVDEQPVDVRGPLVLTPHVPGFATPGDEVAVTVGVFSNLDAPVTAHYTVHTEGGITLDAMQGTVTLLPQREQTLTWKVTATEALGPASLRWSLQLPDGRVVGVGESLSVRPASPYRVSLTTGRFDSDTRALAVGRDLHPELGEVVLGLDATPLVWATGLQRYLQAGQQTRTDLLAARLMPDLVLDEDRVAVQAKLDALWGVLRQRQGSSGGFGGWASNLEVSVPTSLFVTDLLMEAADRGYAVPADMLEQAGHFLATVANQPGGDLTALRERAYAAYLLTRQGVVVSRALADIQEQLQVRYEAHWHQDLAAGYLAASYQLLKQSAVAGRLFDALPWHAGRGAWWREAGGYDALVHDAERLRLALRHFGLAPDRVPAGVLDRLGQYLSEQRHHPVSAALLLRAVDLYGERASGQVRLSARAGEGDASQPLGLSGKPSRAIVPQDVRSLTLRRDGQGSAFYLLSEAGFDRAAADAYQQGLEVSREYLALDGSALAEVQVGEEFLVRVRARLADLNGVATVAVVDLLPGGVEPAVRLGGEDDESDEERPALPIGEPDNDWWPAHVDLRDDRVVLYASLDREARTFVYRVRATHAGQYVVPPAYVEGVTDTQLQSLGAPGRLTVLPAVDDQP